MLIISFIRADDKRTEPSVTSVEQFRSYLFVEAVVSKFCRFKVVHIGSTFSYTRVKIVVHVTPPTSDSE